MLKEEMQEGTSLFTVHANLSVAESSEFSKKLRNGISGAVVRFLRLATGKLFLGISSLF